MTQLRDTILINGLAGTGSSTVAKLLADRTGYEYVYGGGIFRQLAKEAGKSLEEFITAIHDDPEAERAIDQGLMTRAQAGQVIIESRVVAQLLPADQPAFAVWLVCDEEERLRRVAERDKHADVKQRVAEREATDTKRYEALYQIDLSDHDRYQLVIDTTKIPAAGVADQVEQAFHDWQTQA